MAIVIDEKGGAVQFAVRVVPRASTTGIAGEHDGALKIRIASPPVDGAANQELVRFLAKHFGVARGDVEIVAGLSSKNKRVSIKNLSPARFVEEAK